jgi:hypothetical protein
LNKETKMHFVINSKKSSQQIREATADMVKRMSESDSLSEPQRAILITLMKGLIEYDGPLPDEYATQIVENIQQHPLDEIEDMVHVMRDLSDFISNTGQFVTLVAMHRQTSQVFNQNMN